MIAADVEREEGIVDEQHVSDRLAPPVPQHVALYLNVRARTHTHTHTHILVHTHTHTHTHTHILDVLDLIGNYILFQ
jgi:hypothetical protein